MIFITERCDLDVEAADGFDLIAEEFDAQRARVLGRENVQDAAANGILADHLHRIAPLIADRLQMRLDRVERQFFADAQFQREPPVIVRGMRAQQRRRRPARW